MPKPVFKGTALQRLYGGKTRGEAIARGLAPDLVQAHLCAQDAADAGHECDQAAMIMLTARKNIPELMEALHDQRSVT